MCYSIDFETLDKFSNIITWLFVVAGWVVVNNMNSRREKKKDLRLLLDSIRNEIIEIERIGVSYHSVIKSKFEENEHDILNKIDRVSTRLEYVCAGFAQKELIDLKKSITLNNFQVSTSDKQKYDRNSVFVKNIMGSSKDLCGAIESKYYSLY